MSAPPHERLRFENLGFSYREGQRVFTSLNDSILAGESVALTGVSGSGKSTLLYVLGLMLRARAGTLFVEGQSVGDLPDRERSLLRAKKFGFVFQDAVLDPRKTVLDNVLETALYRGEHPRSRTDKALELLKEMGVIARAGHRPGEISGGQAQRIAVCRALLHSPTILLADEPTGNLDPDSSKRVIRALTRQADSGAAVVIATHDRSVVEQCQRVIHLD
jgi:ABC-type lipoprotein export system ATPase subunit